MIEVRKDVLKETGGQQVPWDHSALTSDFYFHRTADRSERGVGTDEAERQLKEENPFAALDALAASQSWSELHDHLTDVSPPSATPIGSAGGAGRHWRAWRRVGPGGSADERLR